ncbi:MAG: hypothetical protein QOI48_3842 [Solirubrobacteraceae bacterium]|nr:hypothetical protein [Solirubrobacteraceae bacterium]
MDSYLAGGTADDEPEFSVRTYEYFADPDRLTRGVMDRMLVVP